MIVQIVFLHIFFEACFGQTKNVCNNFQDFSNMENSENCWHSPDLFTTPDKIARNHGYALKYHKVVTEDGYILTLFRVQDQFSMKKKPPIFLQHGLMCSGMAFMTAAERSLAFYLAKNGYDVWIGNHRGTIYSSRHVHLNASDPQLWNFSFHEIGFYDVPAVLEHIWQKTHGFNKIIYVGHSMGCTANFIYNSLKPQHAQKYLKGFIALNCPTSMKYFPEPMKPLVPQLKNLLEDIMQENTYEFLPIPKVFGKFLQRFCKMNLGICMLGLNYFFGTDDKQFTPEDVLMLLSYTPTRTSLKCINHFLQIITVGRFQMYDYGPAENQIFYNSTTPPTYPLENVAIPSHLLYGLNDNLISEQDIEWTFKELKMSQKSMMPVPQINTGVKYNHMNVLYGKNCESYFLNPLMDILNTFK